MPRKVHLFLATIALVALGGLTLLAMTGPTTASSHLEEVATGLDNPRGVAIGPQGAIYVAEAGRGGNGPCTAGARSEICYGATGAVTRIKKGKQKRIATGLPSQVNESGSEVIGPADISFHRGSAYIVMGLGEGPDVRSGLGEAGSDFGQLARMSASGRTRNVADFVAYEAVANPDGGEINSNPNAVLVLPGKRIVVDAAGNSLLQVSASGDISILAVFPDRMVDAPPFLNLPPGTQIPMQSVPTAVALGPDGAFYVGELSGFPFPVGESRIYRVVPGQDPEVYLEGFTHVIDIAFGPDGSLYVLEISQESLTNVLVFGGPLAQGALIRVNPDHSQDLLASEGLTMPAGIALARDGEAIYISDCGVCIADGRLLRLELDDDDHDDEGEGGDDKDKDKKGSGKDKDKGGRRGN